MKKAAFLLVYLFFYNAINAQTVSLISQGSLWKYLDNGSNQGTAWRASGFNDVAWASGNAQLGYGDGGEATLVSYGPSSTNKYRTTYFRKSFTVSSPSAYSSFTLGLLRDDGAVVYLNGVEVARSNMPTGTISYTKLASTNITGANESIFYNFALSPSAFVSGTNVFAVEVHQVSAGSPDLSFDLKLDAILVQSCGTPASLTASAITSSSALLSWAAVSGASSYNVQYRVSGSATWTTATSTSNTITVSGLSSATLYEYSVQAVCAVAGAFSITANFSTVAGGNDTLIPANASWKYLDNGTDQGTLWRANSFDDAAWANGNAELGYGDGGETTVVSYGANAANKYITTYFRKAFNVANPQAYATLSLNVVRDDGIVVYLNGSEVYRNNLPTGTIAYNTLAPVAIGGADETAWVTSIVNTSSLVQGANVIAVEIHQQAITSSDVSFNLRLVGSGTAQTPFVTRGAYLQKLTSGSIVIRWRTDIACDSKVQYGTDLLYGSSAYDGALTTEHSVTLTGLTAATKYYYTIGTSLQILQGDSKNNFYTAPTTGSIIPVRIWATGDFGNGSTEQIAVRDAYSNYTGTTPTHLWIWMGDNAYNSGTDSEYQDYVFSKYPDQLKSFPLFPNPGNHDYGNAGYQSSSALTTNFPYFNNFSVPQAGEAGGVASNTPKYYSYNYSNIHFVSLDSYGSLNTTTSAMYNWLNADLAANTQRWTVVYFHHPPYTKGSHNSDTATELVKMRTNIVPLLESYHVDVVLCGHSHVNERSYLIKGHLGLASTFTQAMKINTGTNTFTKSPPFDGTVYTTCGTSGQSPGAVQADYPMPCMFFNNNTNNCSLVLDINGDNLSCKYLASTGVIVDQYTITKSGMRMAGEEKETTEPLNVYSTNGETIVSYYLEENATVKMELLNTVGQTIRLFNEIPSHQNKGYYQFELQMPQQPFNNGVYFIRMIANGKILIRKVALVN